MHAASSPPRLAGPPSSSLSSTWPRPRSASASLVSRRRRKARSHAIARTIMAAEAAPCSSNRRPASRNMRSARRWLPSRCIATARPAMASARSAGGAASSSATTLYDSAARPSLFRCSDNTAWSSDASQRTELREIDSYTLVSRWNSSSASSAWLAASMARPMSWPSAAWRSGSSTAAPCSRQSSPQRSALASWPAASTSTTFDSRGRIRSQVKARSNIFTFPRHPVARLASMQSMLGTGSTNRLKIARREAQQRAARHTEQS
jgi:hypothetical protein